MNKILFGDCRDTLPTIDVKARMCVTSPPYYGLRNYGNEDNQIGQEETPEQFIENLSNTDEITSLPEEEQLKPEILDDSIYEDTPTFSSDDELNDLLNRVDDLLNTYSN